MIYVYICVCEKVRQELSVVFARFAYNRSPHQCDYEVGTEVDDGVLVDAVVDAEVDSVVDAGADSVVDSAVDSVVDAGVDSVAVDSEALTSAGRSITFALLSTDEGCCKSSERSLAIVCVLKIFACSRRTNSVSNTIERE